MAHGSKCQQVSEAVKPSDFTDEHTAAVPDPHIQPFEVAHCLLGKTNQSPPRGTFPTTRCMREPKSKLNDLVNFELRHLKSKLDLRLA